MSEQTLLLSIRPTYAASIFNGSKTVELRRTKPRLVAGDIVLVYVSHPVRALAGAFEVDGVIADRPDRLWKQIGHASGVSLDEFRKYFEGTEQGYGIRIRSAWKFPSTTPLRLLRQLIPSFHPPQVFRYLGVSDIQRLGCIPHRQLAA